MLELVSSIDSLISNLLPPLIRIILWATISAALSMFLYKLLSPQKRLTLLKAQQKNARKSLLSYDGEFAGMMALITKDLTLASKQIGLVFFPFALSMIPTLALIFCLFTLYGYALPQTEAPTTLRIEPASAPISWPDHGNIQKMPSGWKIAWPDIRHPITIKDQKGNHVLQLPLIAAIPEITKKDWLNTLFPNPAGIIPKESLINAVYIDIPNKHYTNFGPDWMRGFTFWYFTILLVASLFIKHRFRII